MPKVTFIPLGKTKEIKTGATILAAANQVQVPIGQSCSGDGVCGWCRVRILDGLNNLKPPSALERKVMETNMYGPNERAACMAEVRGDVSVTTTYWGNQ
jgi:2Fe-2S ferredoxin